jgi:thioredoxin-related protein
METLKRNTLERVTNWAVLIVAVIVAFSFLKHDLEPHARPGAGFTADAVPLSSITSNPARLNLVLGISTTCHFCEQNVGFYQKLGALETPGKVSFYTVFPQPSAEVAGFLRAKDLHPTAAVSQPLAQYSISGTPTLLLVSNTGKVLHSWVGALDPAHQAEVIKQVQQYD